MLVPEIKWDVCNACVPCQARQACRTRAILQVDTGDPPIIEPARCTGCGLCVVACCCDAITLRNGGMPGQNVGHPGRYG